MGTTVPGGGPAAQDVDFHVANIESLIGPDAEVGHGGQQHVRGRLVVLHVVRPQHLLDRRPDAQHVQKLLGERPLLVAAHPQEPAGAFQGPQRRGGAGHQAGAGAHDAGVVSAVSRVPTSTWAKAATLVGSG